MTGLAGKPEASDVNGFIYPIRSFDSLSPEGLLAKVLAAGRSGGPNVIEPSGRVLEHRTAWVGS